MDQSLFVWQFSYIKYQKDLTEVKNDKTQTPYMYMHTEVQYNKYIHTQTHLHTYSSCHRRDIKKTRN